MTVSRRSSAWNFWVSIVLGVSTALLCLGCGGPSGEENRSDTAKLGDALIEYSRINESIILEMPHHPDSQSVYENLVLLVEELAPEMGTAEVVAQYAPNSNLTLYALDQAVLEAGEADSAMAIAVLDRISALHGHERAGRYAWHLLLRELANSDADKFFSIINDCLASPERPKSLKRIALGSRIEFFLDRDDGDRVVTDAYKLWELTDPEEADEFVRYVLDSSFKRYGHFLEADLIDIEAEGKDVSTYVATNYTSARDYYPEVYGELDTPVVFSRELLGKGAQETGEVILLWAQRSCALAHHHSMEELREWNQIFLRWADASKLADNLRIQEIPVVLRLLSTTALSNQLASAHVHSSSSNLAQAEEKLLDEMEILYTELFSRYVSESGRPDALMSGSLLASMEHFSISGRTPQRPVQIYDLLFARMVEPLSRCNVQYAKAKYLKDGLGLRENAINAFVELTEAGECESVVERGLYDLGVLYLEESRWDGAYSSFMRCLDLAPQGSNAARAMIMSGYCEMQLGISGGRDRIIEYTRSNPESAIAPTGLLLVAKSLLSEQDYDGALAILRELQDRYAGTREANEAVTYISRLSNLDE